MTFPEPPLTGWLYEIATGGWIVRSGMSEAGETLKVQVVPIGWRRTELDELQKIRAADGEMARINYELAQEVERLEMEYAEVLDELSELRNHTATIPVPPKLKEHPAIPVLRELYRQASLRGHASQWACEIANLARDAIDLILTTPAAPQAPVEAEESDTGYDNDIDVVCEAIDDTGMTLFLAIERMHTTLLRIEKTMKTKPGGEP